jgi:porin
LLFDHSSFVGRSARGALFARPRGELALCAASLAALLAASSARADQANAPAATPAAASANTPASPTSPNDFIEQPVGDYATSTAPAPASPAAQSGSVQPPPQASAAPAASTGGPFGFLNGIGHSSNMLGDMWGLRPALAQFGMTLTIQEQSEILGNVTGGTRQGFDYEGLTTATLQMDTQRAFGWYGGLFNVSALQIHGRNLSTDDLSTLQTASGIEADRATRLWELWYQQQLFDNKIDVKIGQQSLDQEFMVSQNSNYFINTMMGWPMLPSADMPGGGPAYPLSALGVRVRAHPTDSVTILAGVFNGSPVSNNSGDPQMRNPSGTSFPINGGALAIAELQYSYPSQGTLVKAGEDDPLARTYKVGFWYDSESFADMRFDNTGLPLADPASTGIPAAHRGNYAFYAVADQMIYRFENDTDRNINVFIRPMFTPLQDRNLISFSVNGGLTMHEPFFERDDDTAGIGFGYTQVSDSVTGFDQDTAFYNPGVYSPVRHGETFIEATYQYEITPWWNVQPDIQYVFNPGAGVINPNNPTQKIKNEAVIGIRTNITF